MKKIIICSFIILLAHAVKAQEKTFTGQDSLYWKDFSSFIDSAKLQTIERFYDYFSITICKDVYTVTFRCDCNPHFNKGVGLQKNNVDMPLAELPALKLKILSAIKQKKLKEKTSHGETSYKIACP